MTLRQALKEGKAEQLELDVYLLADGRIVKYDRYWGPRQNRNMWVDENGNAYQNFSDIYYRVNAYYYA